MTKKETRTFRVDDWFHKYIMKQKYEQDYNSVQELFLDKMKLTKKQIQNELKRNKR